MGAKHVSQAETASAERSELTKLCGAAVNLTSRGPIQARHFNPPTGTRKATMLSLLSAESSRRARKLRPACSIGKTHAVLLITATTQMAVRRDAGQRSLSLLPCPRHRGLRKEARRSRYEEGESSLPLTAVATMKAPSLSSHDNLFPLLLSKHLLFAVCISCRHVPLESSRLTIVCVNRYLHPSGTYITKHTSRLKPFRYLQLKLSTGAATHKA